MPRIKGQRLMKYFDQALVFTAGVGFDAVQFFNKYGANPPFTPKWSDKPLLKSWQKTKPPLGWPRETDSLCPGCVKEAREKILSGEDVKEILDNALKIKPRRQMSVQFSGGEPTMSPYFVDAIRYARQLGYNSVQAATNGIEFAKNKEFCRRAFEAGLRYAYLQFDGIGNDANSHRQVGNLFDVKLRAIENMHEAGIEIILVVTIVNNVNNDQVGAVVKFAMENPKKISFVAFQPVSFTGRDEDITPERRLRQRYTLSHLAYDVKNQLGITEPTRDWFPVSLIGAFTDFADLVHGPQTEWGQLSCGCHPNCGVGTVLMINKKNKEWAPIPQFVDVPGLTRDLQKITDAARGKWFSNFMAGLAVLKHFKPDLAPLSLGPLDLLRSLDLVFAGRGEEKSKKLYGNTGSDRTLDDTLKRRSYPWNLLVI